MRVPGRYEVRVALVLGGPIGWLLRFGGEGGARRMAIARSREQLSEQRSGVAMRAYPTPECITLLVHELDLARTQDR